MMMLLPFAVGILQFSSFTAAAEQHPIAGAGSVSIAPSYRKELLSLHKSLVSIPSISGSEIEVGDFLIDYLSARSFIAKRQVVPSNSSAGKDHFNVIAWPSLQASRHRPRVLVTSHIDCVPPHIPYNIDVKPGAGVDADTVISGRGSVDAKASVSAQIVAVGELLAAGEIDPRDVMMLFVVNEETTGSGMKHFSAVRKERSDADFAAAIFGEPTEKKLACGHKGMDSCVIHAKGKAGHSGYPELGKSATAVLARALVKILDADLGSSDRFGNTTVNIGRLSGGVASNVIASKASANLAIRIAAGDQETGANIVEGRLADILKETDEESLSLDCVTGYGPIECGCDVDGFDTMIVKYGTDVPHLAGNHTRYLYGPGSILLAHGDDESLKVRDLEDAVEGYKALIKHALKTPPQRKL